MKEISFRNDVLPLKDKLFRLALRITLNREEAEDIVQDTLIKVSLVCLLMSEWNFHFSIHFLKMRKKIKILHLLLQAH